MRLLITAVVFGLALISPDSDQAGGKLTNAQVIELLKSGLTEAVVLKAIGDSEPSFDLSATGLLALKKANVPDKVIEAMQDAAKRSKSKAAPDTPSRPTSLTREQAGAILKRAPELNHVLEVTLRQRRECEEPLSTAEKFRQAQLGYIDSSIPQNNDQQARGLAALSALGFIEISTVAPNPRECRSPDARVRVTTFTDAAQKEVKASRWRAANDGFFVAPVSRVALREVTGIQIAGTEARVEFTWKWTPEYGKPTVRDHPTTLVRATAIMRLYDDGWRLVRDQMFVAGFRESSGAHFGVVDYGTDFPTAISTNRTPSELKSELSAATTSSPTERSPEVSRQFAESAAREGRYVSAINPGRTALSGGQTIRLVLRHHHAVSMNLPYCEGELELSPQSVSFRSSNESHSFRAAQVQSTQALNQPGAEGRVEVRIAVAAGNGKPDNRTITVWVKAAAPKQGYRTLECPGCLTEARGLAELIGLVKQK